MVFNDAVATQGTVTQLVAIIRNVRREAPCSRRGRRGQFCS
jgi:hypothetical protein